MRASARGVRFVLVSSSSVYGDARELPTPEHAPPAPLNPYAASKVAAEAAVREHGADAVIVRPFTCTGPGQRPEMAFARWIDLPPHRQPLPWYAPPGTARDFTYVDDAVAGILAALRRGRAGEAYNLSGWRSVELRAALGVLEEAVGLPGARFATTPGSARRGSRDARAAGARPPRSSATRRAWTSPPASNASSRRPALAGSPPSPCLGVLLRLLELGLDRVGLVRDLEPLLEDRDGLVRAARPAAVTCRG